MPLKPIKFRKPKPPSERNVIPSDIVGYETEINILNEDIAEKASSDALAEVAFSGNYDDLTNTPALMPAGVVLPYGGSAAPTGYLLADGASYLRTDYADLFAAIGTTYGAADGTHFNVPNLKGKIPVGLNASDADFDMLGETGGAKTSASSGTNSAPIFTGSALATHTHGTGSYAASVHTGTAVAAHPAHTHDVTTNVTVNDHAAHTHSVTSNVTVNDHAAHTHNVTATGTVSQPTFTGNAVAAATTNATPDLVTSNTTGTGVSPVTTATGTVSQPTFTGSQVASGNPSATLTHTPVNNAVTSGNPSATLTHTMNNPSVTSDDPSASLTHSVTQPDNHTLSGSSEAVSGGTPAGTVTAPTYTGNQQSIVQPYLVLNYIIKI